MSRSSKGSSFERKMCKEFSLWWTNGERDDVFWRTAMSGGRATVRARKGMGTHGQYGDLSAIDPIGEPFTKAIVTEFKRGYTKAFDLMTLLDEEPPKGHPLFAFAKQAQEAANNVQGESSGQWLLIVKRDQHDPVCFVPTDTYLPTERIKKRWTLRNVRMIAFPLASFFEHFKADDFDMEAWLPS